jgi:tetratricopeptide (TPR) repeat protein
MVLVFFALGLMSKPMLVTLPFILLLLDYWPLRRFRELPLSRLVVEKLPFLLLSAASCAVTFVAQSREHSVAPLERIPMDLRFENAAVSYVGYLFKLVWPTHLSVIYPFPKQIPWTLWLPAVIVLLFISWLVWRARGRKPQWLVGWYWYLGMTVPVIGLVQVGAQSMADRYTYLPLIGVAVALTFGISIPNTLPRLGRAMRIALPSLILAGCLVGTGIQLRHWRDSESLFNHALAVTGENSVAHSNLATVLFREGRMDDALPHLRKAIELDRYDTEARMKLAVVLLRKGQVDEAIELSRVAAQMRPDSAPAQYNLGNALLQKGSLEEAITQFQKALELQPDFVDADNNLGSALLRSDRAAQAIPYFQKVLETRPGDAKAQSNLAVGLMHVGKVEEALKYFRQTAELGPRNKSAHNNLAKALLQIGRQDEALVEFQRVVEIDPQDAETWGRLGMIYLGKHELGEGIKCFEQLLKVQPENVQVLNDSAWILATCPDGSVRNGAQAVEWAARASELTKGSNPAILATLAAAYAEAGRFNEAVEISRKVLELMSGARDSAKVEELQHRLEQYQAGAAYRDPALR